MKRFIKKTIFFMPLLACSLLATGCFEDDEDDYTPGICDDFQAEWNNFNSKANSWATNPTKSGCSTLKQSAITLMDKVKNCPGGEGAEDVIKHWQELDCSVF